MGNHLCLHSFDPILDENSADLTTRLRKRIHMISFKPDVNSSAEALALKLEIIKEYRIIRQIGKGCFSKVFLAIDSLGRKVALKVILKEKFKTRELIKKIIIEKEILKTVHHRSILKLYRTMQTTSHIYFVLEYAERGNLVDLINTKQLSASQIRVILAQVIEGLFYLHGQGIIYGDLKAENILIKDSGIVKLCDFNLSGTSSLLRDSAQGTPFYVSPEILEGCDRTPKSDIWALGVLTYLLTYRQMPFKHSNQKELVAEILFKEIENEPINWETPKELHQFIKDLLVKDFRKRIGSEFSDFVGHPFFEGFDWSGYQNDPTNFSYVNEVNPIDKQDDLPMNPDFQANNESLLFSPNQSFVYDITDFSYQAKPSFETEKENRRQPSEFPKLIENEIVPSSLESDAK
jgi:serine kinase